MNNSEQKTDRDLWRVMVYATTLGFGGLAAFLASFESMRENPTLVLSWQTVAGFLVGAALGWGFWRVIKHLSEQEEKDKIGH